MDPYALPCHPALALTPADRDWRAIGVRSADEVLRKQTRCPTCKTAWTAFQRTVDAATTVEWLRPTPFRVTAVPLPGDAAIVWQDVGTAAGTSTDDTVGSGTSTEDAGTQNPVHVAALTAQTAGLGPAWERSVQLVTPVHVLTAGGRVVAVPGDLLLERREKWNAQDRRLALLWSPRLQRQVVAWHGYARLLQA